MNIIETIKGWVNDNGDHYSSVENFTDDFFQFLDTLKEQPVCEGVEEEIKRFQKEVWDYDTTLSDIARHFAQWQKEQIIKRATTAIKERWYDKFDTTLLGGLIQLGMDKQKEQMMKEEVGWNQDVLKDLKKAGKPWNEAELWVKEYANKENGFDEASAKVGYATGYQVRERQMLKEAVEGEVKNTFGYKTIRPDLKQMDTIVESFSEGDKVRIVIVKED